MSTPTISTLTPADRARAAIGIALGIACPTAVPLRDGRVWLTSRYDALPAYVVRALEAQLARRAADHARDDRLLAEAVAVLGAEIARARGESPADGATAALDRYLHAPGVDQSHRDEAEAMLRVALRSAAPDSPAAAARLDALSGTTKPVLPSEIVSASREISNDARLLGATTPSGPRRSGRHRVGAGVSHRRASGRQTFTRIVRGTGLVTGTGSRPSLDPDLNERTALAVLAGMSQDDLSASLTAQPTVDAQARLAVVMMSASDVPQHVRVEVLPTVGGLVAQGTLHSGTANDPHVLRISPRLGDSQLRHVWAHQLSLMTQQLAAEQAARPRGILGRLKSALGTERRDRRLHADNAAYQLLVRDWQQASTETAANGRPSGPRSVADLERDLQGLAKAIKQRSGREPALPWVAGSIQVPDASATGFAAARAEADATPARHTPDHLRQQVTAQIAQLEASVADLDTKAGAKERTAAAATAEAKKNNAEAETEDSAKDQFAPERARTLRKAAVAASNKAARHTEIAGTYTQAAAEARHALAGYQALLGELDDPNHTQARIAELARDAAGRVESYERSLDQAVPVKDLLETGVPTGKRLDLPVTEINKMLRANRSRARITSSGPVPMPAAAYRQALSPDGLVLTVDGPGDDDVSKVAQVRLRMKRRDLTEVIDRDYELAEQMSGSLGEGGQSVGTTSTHTSTVTVGADARPVLMATAPGVGAVVSASGQVSRGKSLGTSANASMTTQKGGVDAYQGESLLYEWTGEWEIETRNSPTEPWSAVETVDVGRQLTWVPSAYTVKPPAETVSLAELGRASEVTKEFPRHTVTRFTGLQSINDRLVAAAQARYGGIDRVTYDHISGLITRDPHRLLGDAAAPGGIWRAIPSGGESEYELTLEMEPIWATAELSGEPSTEARQEEVLVDFAGTSASQTYGTSATGTASVSGRTLISPNASVGRTVSRSGGQSVSSTAITPAVHRNEGPTQGVIVAFRVTATLHKLDDPQAEPIVIKDLCDARLRVPENDLLRAGGRASKAAVLRDPDGNVRLDQDRRALLRGDPEPPTGPQTMPPWHGTGRNQLRGLGKSLPQTLRGADEAQKQALRELSAMGLVPPLDPVTYVPLMDQLPKDKLRRASQLRNYERIKQEISAQRLEAGIDQACQGGLIVVLDDHQTGHTPHYRNFRLSVTQDFDDVEGRGTSTSETVVRLGISSRATGRTSGRSKSVPVSAGVGASDGPDKGIRGWVGRIGLKLSRNTLGRNLSWTAGRRVQRVTLNESTGTLDRVRQGIRITFTEVTDRGESEPLADVRGSVEVAYESALSRAEPPVFEAQPKPPHALAIQAGMAVAVDAGRRGDPNDPNDRHDPADLIFRAVPAIRADTSALAQLHTHLSPYALLANKEWMNGKYELPMAVIPAPANPAQALADGTLLPQELKIVVRGEATSLTYAAASNQNTADINFTLTDAGFTSGTSASGGASLDAGGGITEASGSGRTGGLTVGRTGGTSQSTTNSQTSGEERLLVNTGAHYEFIERYKLVADIMQGDRVIQTVPLEDARVQKAMPERHALELYANKKLDLPLHVTADAAERYLAGKLELDLRTAQGFVRRYQQEKAGATTGLAPTHTAERLTEKVRAQARVPASHVESAAERLDKTLNRVKKLAEQPRVVHMSTRAYDASLGASKIESITPEGRPDEQVKLLELIRPQIQEIAPDLLNANALLDAELAVDLDPDSYQGHLEDMLGPRGYIGAIEVPVAGRELPDVLLVEVRAHYEGDITIDGTPDLPDGKPDIPKVEAIGIDQPYDYVSEDRTVGHTTTYSGSAQGAGGSANVGVTGGAGTDRTRQHTAGSGEQNTTLDGVGHFDLGKVKRKLVFTTEVVRLHNAGAATMASLRWKLDRTTMAEVTTAAQPRQLRADLTALVPRKAISDGPAPALTVDDRLPEHRTFVLPESAVVQRAVPYAESQGEPESDQLYDKLTAYLGRPDVLGEAGLAEHVPELTAQLKPTALKAKFERLTNAGLELPPLAGRGNGPTTVVVTVNARPVGWELDDDPSEGQVRKVRRIQKSTRSSTSGNHLTPATVTGGFNAGVVSVAKSVGEQVKETSTDATGTRWETSRFEEGHLVTVRIPVVYDATVRETSDKGRGTPATTRTTQLPNLAKGEFYVEMLKHEYLEVLRQMEEGASMDAVLAGARLQAVPEKLGKPDLEATEYGQGKSGPVHQPYRPLLQAIAKAVDEQKPVVLSVREADGHERLYQAFPNGTMAGVNDGGFASAFSTLHPTLALMAEGRVDLRKLYNTSSQEGSFSAKVAAELEKTGVPAAVLKGLDYSSTARQLASNPGVKHDPGGSTASRTIAAPGHSL